MVKVKTNEDNENDNLMPKIVKMSSMEDTSGSNPTAELSLDAAKETYASKSKVKKKPYKSDVWDITLKLQKWKEQSLLWTSHKGDAIGGAIESCMLDWGIEKLCTITVDNASSNDTAIASLRRRIVKTNASSQNCLMLDGDFLHVRCCAHILNLIVKDGLNEAKMSINNIRGAVRYIRSSPAISQRFKECVEKEKITCKSLLCLDIQTRWNSTYLMLDAALKFQKAFERMEEEDSSYLIDLKDAVPTEFDWDNARLLHKFLKSFYNMTNRLSGTLYVTSNIYFHEVCAIEKILFDWSKNVDPSLKLMAMKMKEKFDKYWGDIEKVNIILLVEVVLDPRYKLEYVTFCYSRLYSCEKVNLLEKRVRDTLHRLFEYYQRVDSLSSSSSSTPKVASDIDVDQPSVEGCEQAKSDFMSDFRKKLRQDKGLECKTELDRYLEEDVEEGGSTFEILYWWKLNCSRFHVLSLIARDVLAIPVSTVASESAFSTGGRVLDNFRSSLTPKLVEYLICTQDWLRASPIPIDIEENLHDLEDFESGIATDLNLLILTHE
ncbi:zinc finger BED domain-containing protein RICESLEEPER 2-like [Tasmannia lanceolata]|uniref:zinc finger BED domain-containing protein RICESLEEPER 2-like n=1 Tax=Tasmannia lanceolata TaxID=3420 RepID=UPI004063ABBC